ncbi:glutaredoxin family protein [Corynebacterium coyleae]|uniref:glutaredoxin family protein n=1 Tax=Corynebacterium coyleae TaxID=53374 RepID=UPI001CC958FA|nr:glutaredoxin family protein [Corynebacterium coyleae]UBI10014.1 glutaredoxin family protein [Corynebacterium coyleae]
MSKKITVYTRPNCPHCVHTKKLLDNLSLAYDEVDLIENPAALAKIKDEWGFTQAPVVETEDDVWSGHRPERIRDIER